MQDDEKCYLDDIKCCPHEMNCQPDVMKSHLNEIILYFILAFISLCVYIIAAAKHLPSIIRVIIHTDSFYEIIGYAWM